MVDPHWQLRRAKEMRADPTVGERLLWEELRAGRTGNKFRRQVPIGPYIADFVCRGAGLVVEVDGDSHTDPARDRDRDRWFDAHGWFVLRFWDHEVIEDIETTVNAILRAIEDPASIVDPLHEEG